MRPSIGMLAATLVASLIPTAALEPPLTYCPMNQNSGCHVDPGVARTERYVCVTELAQDFYDLFDLSLPGTALDGQEINFLLAHPSRKPRSKNPRPCEKDWKGGKQYPIFLWNPGDARSYTYYGYLADHVARNGWIVVVVDSGGKDLVAAPSDRAFVMDHVLGQLLKGIKKKWFADRWNGQLVVGGHGQGGEAAVQLALAPGREPGGRARLRRRGCAAATAASGGRTTPAVRISSC